MSRYIDADALIEKMEADAEHIDNYMAQMLLYASINDAKNAPAADVRENVRGEWIPEIIHIPVCDTETEVILFKCSLCGYSEDGESKFCASCGADMRKEVKSC